MCPGRAITSENDELLSTKEHNHEGNEVEVDLLKVVCAMKERAKTELGRSLDFYFHIFLNAVTL